MTARRTLLIVSYHFAPSPLVGAKLAIAGGCGTVKLLALAAVTPGVVTAIGPVVAPAGISDEDEKALFALLLYLMSTPQRLHGAGEQK